jgi:hypothetical protein
MSTLTDPEEMDDSANDKTRLSTSFSFVSSIRFIGFWAAVVLPFLYVPLLTSGLDTPGQQQTFLLLLAANVVALFFGHRYRNRA